MQIKYLALLRGNDFKIFVFILGKYDSLFFEFQAEKNKGTKRISYQFNTSCRFIGCVLISYLTMSCLYKTYTVLYLVLAL